MPCDHHRFPVTMSFSPSPSMSTSDSACSSVNATDLSVSSQLLRSSGVASGSSSSAVVIGFWAALIVAWAWIANLAVRLYRQV